jgi:exocyst complex component 2
MQSTQAVKYIALYHIFFPISDRLTFHQNLRVLLTLSNISALRTSIVPSLVQHFESSFSVTLTEESGSIADLFQRIESQLFQSYTAPKAASLSILVHAGITSPAWEPAGVNHAPAAVSQYIYAALLQLVHVHSEVSSAAPPLVPRILSHLLEQTSRALLEAFQARASTTSGYSLSALMQATLDVEFFAQTLSVYATKRAGEVQSSIYRELDQGTDNNARVKLQDELPQMRAVLKRLREATRGEFACFRKVKKESGAAPVPVR